MMQISNELFDEFKKDYWDLQNKYYEKLHPLLFFYIYINVGCQACLHSAPTHSAAIELLKHAFDQALVANKKSRKGKDENKTV